MIVAVGAYGIGQVVWALLLQKLHFLLSCNAGNELCCDVLLSL